MKKFKRRQTSLPFSKMTENSNLVPVMNGSTVKCFLSSNKENHSGIGGYYKQKKIIASKFYFYASFLIFYTSCLIKNASLVFLNSIKPMILTVVALDEST